MKKYREPSKDIPVTDEVDVLVVGAGPAGFSAAVCAAEQGAKTLLVDQSGAVGGVATSGLMSHWTGNTAGGIYERILDRSYDFCDGDEKIPSYARRIINPEKLKTVMLDMLREAGAGLRLYTFACEAAMEGRQITGVITQSKSGRGLIAAKVVVDASGDGDIAARAGVPFHMGRESDGRMQPMTLMFKVAGVDTDRAVMPGSFEDSYPLPQGDLQTLAKEHLPPPAGHVLLYYSSLPGIVTCNMTNCIDADGTKAEDLTRAEAVCRGQMGPIVTFLREYVPGFERCYVISSAAMIGVRETRHFHGEYTLTQDDILQARFFDDWAVTRAHFNFDVHSVTGSGLDETGCQAGFRQKKGYTIPYRCLVPKEVDGLLLAGRNISGTHMAHSNYRAMPICANMGQAAGVAAALCAQRGTLPRELDVKALQQVLRLQGVEP